MMEKLEIILDLFEDHWGQMALKGLKVTTGLLLLLKVLSLNLQT